MDSTNTQIAVCIYCLTRYHVPPEYEGKRVFCKNCGGYFNLLFEFSSEAHETGVETGPGATGASENTQEILPGNTRLLLGNLAIRYNMVTEDEMRMALYLQQEKRDAGQKLLLGEILVTHKMITRSQLNFLLSVQKMMETHELDQKFGEIVIENRFASDSDVQRALKEQRNMFKQRRSIKRLGDIMVKLGMITMGQRDAVLVKQNRLREISGQDDN